MPFSKTPVAIGSYTQLAGTRNNDSLYVDEFEIAYGGHGDDYLGISGNSRKSSILVGGNGADTYRIKSGQFGIIADLRGDDGIDKLIFPLFIGKHCSIDD